MLITVLRCSIIIIIITIIIMTIERLVSGLAVVGARLGAVVGLPHR